jgi:hypothetical protein
MDLRRLSYSILLFIALGFPLAGIARAQDPLPALSVADASVNEGNSGTTALTFVVTRAPASSARTTVLCEIVGVTAQAGTDFSVAQSTTIEFLGGETTRTIQVSVIGDTAPEQNETLQLTLSNPFAATIADNSATGTIRNDDIPTLQINTPQITEGNAGTKSLFFSIIRSGTGIPSSVTVATQDITAQAGQDYTAISPTTVNFSSTDTSKSVAVTILGDEIVEPDETLRLNLSNPSSATLVSQSATGTITNDDQTQIRLLTPNFEMNEGDSGVLLMSITVERVGSTAGSASVTVSTGAEPPGANNATAGTDYIDVPNTRIDFAPGQSRRTFDVRVNGDTETELNEGFLIFLADAVGAEIGSPSSGRGVILNDDFEKCRLTIVPGAFVMEGDSSTNALTYTVRREGGLNRECAVRYVTTGGTAQAGTDYVAAPDTSVLLIPKQVLSVPITIKSLGDVLMEDDETVGVRIFDPVGAIIEGADTSFGQILDDDAGISITDASGLEDGQIGNSGVVPFTLTRIGKLNRVSTVLYSTANGTAVAGSDFTAVSGTAVTFAIGQANATASVTLLPDALVEGTETFVVNLSSPTNASILDNSASGSIVDNDQPPLSATLSVNDVTVAEEAGQAVFTVTRSGDLSGTSRANYRVMGGSASSSEFPDFIGDNFFHPLSFPPGVTTATIPITIVADDRPEHDETINVVLSDPSGCTLADPDGRATIIDNDDYRFTVQDISVVEGNSGGTTMAFTVRRSPLAPGDSLVSYSIAGGTATSGTDFQALAVNGTLTFLNLEFLKTVEVTVRGDIIAEADETITLTLSNPGNALIADGTGVGTIVNDDAALSISDASAAEGKLDDRLTLRFTVNRSGNSTGSATVVFSTANGTAVAGSDFIVARGTMSFGPGEVHKNVLVTVIGDTTPEPNETFTVTLSSATGAAIIDGVAVGTILSDD